jgi:hypothetical protein
LHINKRVLLCSLVLLAESVFGEDFKTLDGKEYNNATVSRTEPDGIVVRMTSGVVKLYFANLPNDIRERYHYDAEKAAAFSRMQYEHSITREDLPRVDPSLQGGALYHTYHVVGTVVKKLTNGDLIVQCSGSRDTQSAKGRVLLCGHPNTLMLLLSDKVDAYGTALGITHDQGKEIRVYQFSR